MKVITALSNRLSYLYERYRDDALHHECRRCGRTLSGSHDACPACGSTEIATIPL